MRELRQSTLAEIALDFASGAQSGTDDGKILDNMIAVGEYFAGVIHRTMRLYNGADIPFVTTIIAGIGIGSESVTTAKEALKSLALPARGRMPRHF